MHPNAPEVDVRPLSSLRSFALAWRWIGDASPTPLPPAALRALRPMTMEGARTAFARSQALLQGDALNPRSFRTCRIATALLEVPAVSAWLDARRPAMNAEVCLSWEPALALRTRWQVFAGHWSAFCYRASDDIVVYPASLAWAVFHRRDGQLEYGERRNVVPTISKSSGFVQDRAGDASHHCRTPSIKERP